jgi:cytidine deaminase
MPMPSLMPDSEALNQSVLDRLFIAASAVRNHAYAPYSKFKVGAAALSASGHIHAGCNVENAAYPVGTCAEAGAIAAMVAAGETKLIAMLVLGDSREPVTPCGACRQRMREFGTPAMPVLIANPHSIIIRTTLDALLPLSFGPDNLVP